MMFIMRRVFTFIVALCFMSSLCLPALADTWDLTQGSVSVGFQNDAQHVTQGSTTKQDSNPVITSNGTATSNTITISSGEGQTAKVTVDNVNIQTDHGTSGINVTNGSTVEMTVSGTNSVSVMGTGDGETSTTTGNAAAVHIADADVTIQGDGNGGNVLNVNSESKHKTSNGAGIGSNEGEDFDGTLTITGDVTVTGEGAYSGAGIGAGKNGEFSGTLNITDGANVIGESSDDGAAIGGGYGASKSGDFTGEINIVNANVTANSYKNGAGIGGGRGGDFSGNLNIENSDVRARTGYTGQTSSGSWGFGGNGAAIGGGYNGDFTGSVSIKDSSVNATTLNDGAAIGAGGIDNNNQTAVFSGSLVIDNSTVTAEAVNQGIAIGAPGLSSKHTGGDGEFTGSIEINGNSKLNLLDGKNAENGDVALIGANGVSSGSITIEDIVQVNAWSGTIDKSKLSYDRDSYLSATESGGQYTSVGMDVLEDITNGAEVEIVFVPKPAAEVLVYRFWDDVETKIKTADKGDTITINVKERTSIPVRILELVAEYEITLIIQWNGGEDIIVTADHGVEVDAQTILLAELTALLNK